MADIARTADVGEEQAVCGFCGRASSEVGTLVRGRATAICDNCVRDVLAIVEEAEAGVIEAEAAAWEQSQ